MEVEERRGDALPSTINPKGWEAEDDSGLLGISVVLPVSLGRRKGEISGEVSSFILCLRYDKLPERTNSSSVLLVVLGASGSIGRVMEARDGFLFPGKFMVDLLRRGALHVLRWWRVLIGHDF